jgi:hypothetical protein
MQLIACDGRAVKPEELRFLCSGLTELHRKVVEMEHRLRHEPPRQADVN